MSKKSRIEPDKQKVELVPTKMFGSRLSWIRETIGAGHIVRFRFVLEADQSDFLEVCNLYKQKEFIRADEREIVWIYRKPKKVARSNPFPESIRVEFHAISEDRHTTHLFAEIMVTRWLP